ncbi:MAG: cryptochrome/photolyase family protein [Bacteroidales bacterium]|nr:cryptochrome/photolyase family protein [Bacteroidales bacterium]MCF8396529.1 cryptochrome/photolyase family protein [Bacteroidales bacterium]
MKSASLIFPHQLFRNNPCLGKDRQVFIIEESLYFRQYKFHRHKLVHQRASMKYYQDFLEADHSSTYIDASDERTDIRTLIPSLKKQGYTKIHYTLTTDDWLEKRITKAAKEHDVKVVPYETPMFLNTKKDIAAYFSGKKKIFQAHFYKKERKKRKILLEEDGQPTGGKWSFDAENRQKYPAGKKPPEISFPARTPYYEEAIAYTQRNYQDLPGEVHDRITYPHTHKQATAWLQDFLQQRFREFGTYEDALVGQDHFLHHSLLSPLMNNGLLTPAQVLEASIACAKDHDIPMNSVEGFVRQVMGWREFIRGVYDSRGRKERTKNFWGFKKKIPASFWKGETGILPVDITIRKVLKTAYAHHIERLMVLGNFMLLCEFDPDEVYRWFMEMFIDAYDWVMVPNVYGMSQFADGGLMSTKPYISSSNYLMKMSNYPKGEWQETWDALFWRFMHVHREFFLSNPRIGMLVRTFDKMKPEKQKELLKRAEAYLDKLD